MPSAVTLTDAKLKGLKAPDKGQMEISDAKVPGLRIRVGKTGAKTFILRKRVGGKLRNISLGRYGRRFGLADARKNARTVLSDIEAGSDPLGSIRKPDQDSLTIAALWPVYRKSKAKLRSIGAITRVFEKYVLPEFGDRTADTLTRGDITRMIDRIATATPVMARTVHAQMSAFYTWALPRLDRLPTNPCRDAGRPKAPPARDRVLENDELKALWDVAGSERLPWSAGLKLLILTGQRRGEIFQADRNEFDLRSKLWTIPPNRAKNGLSHLVPLSDAAIKILNEIPTFGNSEKLFPARSNPKNGPSGYSRAVKRFRQGMDKKLGRPTENWQLHDLRRTLATGLQRLGIRFEVTEAILNHVSGAKAGLAGVYQRYDWKEEKREALDLWAKEVEIIVF